MLRGSFPKISQDQQVLHVIPMSYTVDGLTGVRNPMGLAGNLVEMEAHVVVGESIVLQNTIKAVEAKDVSVQSLVLQGMASAESTLTGDEREMGVVLLDIGAGTTDLVIYRQGTPWYSAVLPVGGYALTRDLAAALRSPLHVAEEVKIKWGSVYPESVPPDEDVELPAFQGQRRHSVPRQAMAGPLHERMAEILKMALTHVRQAGMTDWPIGGLVLTGGGGQMTGLPELAARMVGRGGPGAGAAAHAHGDEYQVGAGHGLGYFLSALLRSLASQVGVGPSAQPAGQVVTDSHAVGNIQPEQVLGVGVDAVVFHHREFFLVHPAHCVGAAAAHADHLDGGRSGVDFLDHVKSVFRFA